MEDSLQLQYTIESHPRGATLYVHGALSNAGAVLALRACHGLPPAVRDVRVDLRRAHTVDRQALDAVMLILTDWRRRRGGRARVDLPRPEKSRQDAQGRRRVHDAAAPTP